MKAIGATAATDGSSPSLSLPTPKQFSRSGESGERQGYGLGAGCRVGMAGQSPGGAGRTAGKSVRNGAASRSRSDPVRASRTSAAVPSASENPVWYCAVGTAEPTEVSEPELPLAAPRGPGEWPRLPAELRGRVRLSGKREPSATRGRRAGTARKLGSASKTGLARTCRASRCRGPARLGPGAATGRGLRQEGRLS